MVLGALGAARRGAPRPLPPAYRVELVAAPRPAPAETPGPAVAPRPEPPRTATPVERSRREPLRPSPAARPPAAAARAAAPSAPARTEPVATAPPQPGPTGTGGTGADPATVRTEGVEFPFPGYLRNLVAQVYRRWRAPGGNTSLEAEIFFFVQRDGTVSGVQFIRRSGSFAFDLEAQGAIEAAARAGAFGPLPAGYAADVLPVSFFFSPRALR